MFRRAVLELPPPSTDAQETVRMLMHDPEAYQPDAHVSQHWQVIVLCAALDHRLSRFPIQGLHARHLTAQR